MRSRGATRRRGPGRRKNAEQIPWDSIRDEYIHGAADAKGRRLYPTQRDLAAKYECCVQHLSRHAMRERWLERREAFYFQLLDERSKKLAEDLATKASDADMAMYQVSMGTLQQVARRVKEAHERAELIPASVVKDMSMSIRYLQAAVRLALGQETESIHHEHQMTLIDYVKVVDTKAIDAKVIDAKEIDAQDSPKA